MRENKKTYLGMLCSILAETLFGFSFIFTRQVTKNTSSLSLLGWRFLLAFIVMLILIKLRIFHVDFHGKNMRPAFLLAILHPITYFLSETFGIKMTSASESGLIIAIIPIAALICSSLILKIRPTRLQVGGIVITLGGVAFVVLSQRTQPTFNLPGYLLLLLAVISYSLFSVFTSQIKYFTSTEKAFIMISSACLVFSLMAIVENAIKGSLRSLVTLPFTDISFLRAILYLGIGSSILAFTFDNQAILSLGTNRAASFVGLCTVVTVLSGVFFLHEPFSKWQIIGTILIICGVYIANSSRVSEGKRRKE